MGDKTREKLKKMPVIGKIAFPKYTSLKQGFIALGIVFIIAVIAGVLWYWLFWLAPIVAGILLLGVAYWDDIMELFKGKTVSRSQHDIAIVENYVINGVMNTALCWTIVSVPKSPNLIPRQTYEKDGMLYVHVWIPKTQNIHLPPSDLDDICVLLQTQLDALSMAGGIQAPRFFVQSALNAGGMVDIEILLLDCPQAIAYTNQTVKQRQQSLMPKEDDIDDVEF